MLQMQVKLVNKKVLTMCLCCAKASKSDFLATKRCVSKSMPMNCLLFKGITAAEKRTLT